MGEGRDIYHEPQDQVLLRTEDVYQTTADKGVSRYSEQFLSLIAGFDNSGQPEGSNCRCTVGKSKRGEIFVRLFARVNPQTRVIEAAGFKAHGCLAIIGCASMVCTLIQGRTLSAALELGIDELSQAVGGVPEEKHNTLYIAVESVRALVGDYLLREGRSVAELDEAVPCNQYSVGCTMCEHCSLRDARIEKQVEEIRQQEECAARNAVAKALLQVRADSADGRLSTPSAWQEAGLVPGHMGAAELGVRCLEAVEAWKREHAPQAGGEPVEDGGAAEAAPVHPAAKRSRFAPRPVGIPSMLRHEEEDSAQAAATAAHSEQGDPAPSAQQPAAAQEPLDQAAHSEQAPHARAAQQPAAEGVLVEEGPYAGLRIPAGTELRHIEGEWVLVKTGDETAQPQPELEADASGIECLKGADGSLYFYDAGIMSSSFARWAFLGAQDNPLDALAECAREESRRYPRPLSARSLGNDPLFLTEEEVEQAWQQASAREDYADIRKTVASNGSVYFFSTTYLSPQQAAALAEWDAVGRYMNV